MAKGGGRGGGDVDGRGSKGAEGQWKGFPGSERRTKSVAAEGPERVGIGCKHFMRSSPREGVENAGRSGRR